jgi:hypothetical protein
MKCLACGAEMRLMDVRTDTAAPFGIERRVFQCLSCRQIAQRLRLNRPRMAIAHLPAPRSVSEPLDFEPQLQPYGAQSERANVVEEDNSEQSTLKQQPAVDWGLPVERSGIALKQQAVAARASAWARTIEKVRERQMALKEREASVRNTNNNNQFDRRSPTQ